MSGPMAFLSSRRRALCALLVLSELFGTGRGGLLVARREAGRVLLGIGVTARAGKHRAASGSRKARVLVKGPALLANMSTRDKLAQLLMVGVKDGADARAVVDSQHVGGIIIGSWTDLAMMSDGSLDRHRGLCGSAAARGECRRGRRPGVAAGVTDRHAAFAPGAGPDADA